MNARHVRLAVTRTRTGLRATGADSERRAARLYMLFALTRDGVPSIARWVHVRR